MPHSSEKTIPDVWPPEDEGMNEALLIHDIARLQRRNFDRRAQSLGLTRSQWTALVVLKHHPGMSQAEMADRLEVEPITLARIIDRLEVSGWVERRADPSDRRIKRLHLTQQVQSVVQQMRDLALEMRREELAGIDSQEHKTLVATLVKMRANLGGKMGEGK